MMQFMKKVTLASALINEIQHSVIPWPCKDTAWGSPVSSGSSNAFPGLSLVLGRMSQRWGEPCSLTSGCWGQDCGGDGMLVLHTKVMYNPICYNHWETSSLTGELSEPPGWQHRPVGSWLRRGFVERGWWLQYLDKFRGQLLVLVLASHHFTQDSVEKSHKPSKLSRKENEAENPAPLINYVQVGWAGKNALKCEVLSILWLWVPKRPSSSSSGFFFSWRFFSRGGGQIPCA